MFVMNRERMCLEGTMLKLAQPGEVENTWRLSNAMKAVGRDRTEEVESNVMHFSNEHIEVCNEAFPSFNSILVAVSCAVNDAGTGSILASFSKN